MKMSFKIEFNYLNIDNYPILERHFEDKASKGWLIHKIVAGTLFIYKKISPKQLDFSISPYQVETAFTRKSNADLAVFQTVSQSVGWNYATKSYDLHVYYKSTHTEAISIQTDEEEEFKSVEIIAKRQLKAQYITLPFSIFLTYFFIAAIVYHIYPMKSGFMQITALIMPVALLGITLNILDLRKFLKKNRKNLDLGKNLEFNTRNHLMHKFSLLLLYIGCFILIIYCLYTIIFLRNNMFLLSLLPASIGIIGGVLYRIYVKPLNKGLGFKKMTFAIGLVVIMALSGFASIYSFTSLTPNEGNYDTSEYRVLSWNDVADNDPESMGELYRDASILIPRSYEYTSLTDDYDQLRTEYSNALHEKLAINLVNRYLNQAEEILIGNYDQEIDQSFENGIYDPYLSTSGFTETDFEDLMDMIQDDAINRAKQIIQERSITKDNQLWNFDQVYFLNYEKSRIVLRDGNEVFYLEGLDFTDPEIIEISKSKLKLD